MRRIPVDQSKLRFRYVEAEAAMRNGARQQDDEGRGLLALSVLVSPRDPSSDTRAELERVKVPEQGPVKVAELDEVEFVDLVATPWEINGRSGVALRASAVKVKKAAPSA